MVNVVLGAGGPTGLECVKRLLSATSEPVRAVLRDPAKYQGTLPEDPKLEVVAGDVTNKESLIKCLEGAKGIIFAAAGKTYRSPKDVDHKGVENVAEVAKQVGASRVVLVSSALVNPANRWHPIRILLNNIRYSLMDEKYLGEQALRASGVPYTVVRPGGLTNLPGGKEGIAVEQALKEKAGRITRADTAAVCVEALSSPAAGGVTIAISGQPLTGDYEAQLKELFSGTVKDTA